MKLLVVARAIDQMAGGVERTSIGLMNNMLERGLEVELLTWDMAKATSFYAMKPEIKWHRLNMGHPEKKASYALMFQRARVIRTLVRQRDIDIIICFQAGPFLAMMTYLLGMGIPIIASERNSPSRFKHLKAGWYKSIFFQSFRFASQLVVQCESYCANYPDYLNSRIITIPNPVYPTDIHAMPFDSDNGRFRMLSIGRLGYQKNYTVLVKAFSRIATDFPKWDLTIIGDGEERQKLQTLIEELGLVNRVLLPGATDNITEWYVKSHAFCLPSGWEGFPNALAEALAHGLPCIGFEDCSGVRDLIHCGKNGYLAPGNGDENSLAITLKKLMSDHILRKNMSESAIESIKIFEPKKIFDLWEQVIISTAKN
ncbi:MAG: glycosyltransferase family 4 protein [Proteobacteria bacterium]|nr:glycosyltransferase family 4 protein [Pseudomonadota bacterium]